MPQRSGKKLDHCYVDMSLRRRGNLPLEGWRRARCRNPGNPGIHAVRLIGAKHVVQKEEQCTQLLDVGGSDALAGGVEAIVMAPLGLVQSSRKQLRSSNSTALHEDSVRTSRSPTSHTSSRSLASGQIGCLARGGYAPEKREERERDKIINQITAYVGSADKTTWRLLHVIQLSSLEAKSQICLLQYGCKVGPNHTAWVHASPGTKSREAGPRTRAASSRRPGTELHKAGGKALVGRPFHIPCRRESVRTARKRQRRICRTRRSSPCDNDGAVLRSSP